MGLARSGVAAARALLARGEQVVAVDRGSPAEVPDFVEAHVQTDGLAQLAGARAIVKSPGVPREAPVIARARARGMPVLGELELGWRLLPNEFVAVTGTNGKTTTVELLGHIHREAGLPVAVAGNVGTAVSGLAGELDEDATVVCEASSFQLEDTLEFAPDGAVLLNVESDHLDRHGTLEDYLAAKLQVFARQGNDDVAVFPFDLEVDDLGGCARRVPFGPRGELDDRAGHLWWDEEPLIAHDEIRLRGAHNRANAAAAAAIALARGIDRDAVRTGLRTFAGVEHRLEEVARIGDVLFVNDSKATNVASTLVALASFPRDVRVHLILGGQGKGQSFAPLRDTAFATYLIGEDAARIGSEVGGEQCGDLATAVQRARAAATAGDVVLLSPACASFDQFADYEARGRAFKALVSTGPKSG
ncbi:MAG: UDP-N-acetylmuramoylalanine--D-glutamate ligase [uncultured Solirubrobacteraceae bacterium]|uniref:UDP-N-acetylmuramoylalanine--D-glutamate ligase n=1 Tax=uncultured Solirubrobacteraceae bacterium TaxID=1162706 RepID=A0A6J4TWF3_9ACTN|nr:MAG: UDP-N-acetylmuramoylalanine--D-glutamate ligase [uncultured Solirubrobacteraceae bacterium]